MRISAIGHTVCLLGLLVAAPTLARAQSGGTVSGKVSVTPAKYLEETVVYVSKVPGQFPHKTVTMDQKGMKFIPHVLALTVGDTVKFLNSDAVGHNVFSPEGGFNLGTFAAGQSRDHAFTKAGAQSILCSLHPEMLAYVWVGQNPYSAVVDKDGTFTIKDVPPGSYQVGVWNSHAKAPEQPVTVAAGQTAQANFTLAK